MNRNDATTVLRQAADQFRAGCYERTKQLCGQVLVADATLADAWNLMGLAANALREGEAVEHLAKAVALDPANAAFFNNYGVGLQQVGRSADALCAFRAALQLRPNYPDALGNLYLALVNLDQQVAADAVVDQGIPTGAITWEVLVAAIQVAVDRGDAPRCEGWFHFAEQWIDQQNRIPEAKAQEGARSELLRMRGQLLLNLGRPEEASLKLQQAMALAPLRDLIHAQASQAWNALDDFDQAHAAVSQARRINPQRLAWKLRELCLSPSVFACEDELLEHRAALERGLDELLGLPPISLDEILAGGFVPPYSLSFQGENDRAIKEKFADICRRAIPPVKPWRRPPGKTRIGFVVTQGHENLFVRILAPVVARIRDDAFEIVVLCSRSIVSRIAAALPGIQIVPLTNHPVTAAKEAAAASCHLLYYLEIGSDLLNYLIPLFRPAPVQCTSWCVQSTSGMKEVDFYLSSALVEEADAQQFYTEHLLRLESLLTIQEPLKRPSDARRDRLGLPATGTLYVCPQTLLKIHPRQDELFRRILEQDRAGYVVLKHGRHPSPGEQLLQRFCRTMPEVADRVIMLPWLSTADFQRLICVADVVLDPIVFSAGSSAYDIFSYGRPIVTHPGKFFPSRFVSACYRRMEFETLIANSESHYVEIAVALGRDDGWRTQMAAQLMHKLPGFFADHIAVTTHCDALRTMIRLAGERVN